MVALPEHGPYLFDPDDVEARIVLLASIVPEARSKFRRLSTLGYRLKRLRDCGSIGRRTSRRIDELERQVAELEARVFACVEEVESIGGQIVDLDTGEVTFPTLIDGRPAYLVWRPGDLVAMWYRFADEAVGQARVIRS